MKTLFRHEETLPPISTIVQRQMAQLGKVPGGPNSLRTRKVEQGATQALTVSTEETATNSNQT
jgi:hypothetical protein